MSTERAPEPPDAVAPSQPPQQKPIDGIALAKEVGLDRLQNLLEWLLTRLKRYRAKRGNWWE